MSRTFVSPPKNATGLRGPATQLMATLVAFVLYLAFAISTIAKEVETSADLSPAQVDDLGVSWMVLHLLWVAPVLIAASALTSLSHQLRGATRFVPGLAAVTVACTTAYLAVNLLAYRSDDATWGESALYPWSVSLSLAAGWLGVLPATILVSTALARQGIARRVAWTVTSLVGLYWVIDVLTYLPLLVGAQELAGFEGGLPPFLLGVFWAILGGGLLRSRVPSQG